MNKEIEGEFVSNTCSLLFRKLHIHSFNLAPDEDLLIRSKYRTPFFNQDVRNYNQISFIFDIINYMQQSAELPTYFILCLNFHKFLRILIFSIFS